MGFCVSRWVLFTREYILKATYPEGAGSCAHGTAHCPSHFRPVSGEEGDKVSASLAQFAPSMRNSPLADCLSFVISWILKIRRSMHLTYFCARFV